MKIVRNIWIGGVCIVVCSTAVLVKFKKLSQVLRVSYFQMTKLQRKSIIYLDFYYQTFPLMLLFALEKGPEQNNNSLLSQQHTKIVFSSLNNNCTYKIKYRFLLQQCMLRPHAQKMLLVLLEHFRCSQLSVSQEALC